MDGRKGEVPELSWSTKENDVNEEETSWERSRGEGNWEIVKRRRRSDRGDSNCRSDQILSNCRSERNTTEMYPGSANCKSGVMEITNGNWSIRCDRQTESEEIWNSVVEVAIEKRYLVPRPPKIIRIEKFPLTDTIYCYTPVFSSEIQIREVAESIRDKCSFPFIMYHYGDLRRTIHKYLHTPEGEFYKSENGLWRPVVNDTAPWNSGKYDLPIQVKDGENQRSSAVMTKSETGKIVGMERFENIKYVLEGLSLSQEIVLPSQVFNKEQLYWPSTEEGIEKMKKRKGGKWIVLSGGNLARQDANWTALVSLCQEGYFIGLKASTAAITEAEKPMDSELILCYTADSEDRNDVKKAADAIRRVIIYEYLMYYKTNDSSEDGKYRLEGCSTVTKYMHTVKGTFYSRDQRNRWVMEKKMP